MDLKEIEDVIAELLAAEMRQDVEECRAELVAAGASLPCDSVIAVEIMVKVEKRFGVQLQLNADTARAMRSVESYAALVAAARQVSLASTALAGDPT